MPLKELTPRHLSIIRRLLTGQPHWEICVDVNISGHYLSSLKKDPLFEAEMERMSFEVEQQFLAEMGDAQVILDRLKTPAALKMKELVEQGTVGGRIVKADKQADIVVKALGITGMNAPERHEHTFGNLTEAVIEAYRLKNRAENEKSEPKQLSDPVEEAIDVTNTS